MSPKLLAFSILMFLLQNISELLHLSYFLKYHLRQQSIQVYRSIPMLRELNGIISNKRSLINDFIHTIWKSENR